MYPWHSILYEVDEDYQQPEWSNVKRYAGGPTFVACATVVEARCTMSAQCKPNHGELKHSCRSVSPKVTAEPGRSSGVRARTKGWTVRSRRFPASRAGSDSELGPWYNFASKRWGQKEEHVGHDW